MVNASHFRDVINAIRCVLQCGLSDPRVVISARGALFQSEFGPIPVP
jgi:hypothetical protein